MKTVYYLIVATLLASCSHKITRTGYSSAKSDDKKCDIQLKKFAALPDSVIKIGEIKLGESGFSTSCSEAHALEILKNEGCAVNATIVNIIEEKRPDLLSSCYRCRAEFYRYNGNVNALRDGNTNNNYYKPEEINNRVTKDRNKNTGIMIAGAVLGFIIGFTLFR